MKGATLEEELDRVLDAHTWKPVAREALKLLLGWGGGGIAGFEVTGRAVRRTRERVRQLLGDFVQSLRSLPPATPTTAQILALLRRRVPCSAQDFEEELRRAGITRGTFRVEGVLTAALVLGRRLPAEIFRGTWPHLARKRVLIDPGANYSWVERARELVKAWELRWGCASLAGVRRDLGRRVSEEDLRVLLSATSSLHPLDAAQDWHAVLPLKLASNRMYLRIARTLGIAREVALEQLKRGLEHDPKHGALPFGQDVLREFCRLCPGLRVDRDVVRAGHDFKEPRLPPRQRQIVRILRQHGGSMPKRQLVSLMMSRMGWKKGTANAYVRTLPFVVHDGASVSLVGPR